MEVKIKMGLNGMGSEGVAWILLAQNVLNVKKVWDHNCS
jgi:hypothetical protein